MPLTVGAVITRAQGIIGEVAGPGVQVYAEDRMLLDVKSAFNMVFTKYGWPQYTRWSRHELDGSTGRVTDNSLSDVKDFTDFLRIVRDGQTEPISLLPSNFNPFSLSNGGTRVKYFTSIPAIEGAYETKKLQFYPLAATGFVNVRARVYPTGTFDENTQLALDEDMLAFATAFFTLAFEDLNPGAADTCKALMEGRYKDLLAALASHPTSASVGGDVVTDWTLIP